MHVQVWLPPRFSFSETVKDIHIGHYMSGSLVYIAWLHSGLQTKFKKVHTTMFIAFVQLSQLKDCTVLKSWELLQKNKTKKTQLFVLIKNAEKIFKNGSTTGSDKLMGLKDGGGLCAAAVVTVGTLS